MKLLSDSDKLSLVTWEESYAVGVPLIDEQHKELILIINKLIYAINENLNKELLLSLFDKLYNYANYHFKSEEQYFYRLNAPDTELHKLQHKHFIEQLNLMRQSFNSNDISHELLWFLTDWLLIHIQDEDKKFLSENL